MKGRPPGKGDAPRGRKPATPGKSFGKPSGAPGRARGGAKAATARKGEGGRWVERAHAATQAEGYEPSVQHRGEERGREEKRREWRRGEEQSRADDARTHPTCPWLTTWLTTP